MKSATKPIIRMPKPQAAVATSCEEIHTASMLGFKDLMKRSKDLAAGKADVEQAKVSAKVAGDAVKLMGTAVQAQHAKANRLKVAMQLAAQERDNTGYKGPQTDLVIAAQAALETGTSAPVHKLLVA